MKFSFIKKKKFYIPAIIVVFLGGFIGYGQYKKANTPPSYELAKVERGDLVQTVEATGKVEAVDDLALRFEIPGTVSNIAVKEGQTVKKGTLLANLKLNEYNAAIAQAQANLNRQLAGSTDEDKKYYASQMESARISLEQARSDAQNNITLAESNLATAKNNLRLNEGQNQSQIVAEAYETALANLRAIVSKLDDALTQVDNILGIDNVHVNDAFENYFEPSRKNLAELHYLTVKSSNASIRSTIESLNIKNPEQIDSALTNSVAALSDMNTMLTETYDLLVSLPAVGISQAEINTKKTTIEGTRTVISSQITTLTAQRQAITNAKNNVNSYTIAYDKAVKDLEQANTNASTLIRIKQETYNQAKATYESKINPPRAVDVASYRAAVSQAVASRDKAIIRAPIDGVVSKINKKVGELISSGEGMVTILSPRYEIKVDISEVDVRKVKFDDKAEITLDSYGQDQKLYGRVLTIETVPTTIQDVVYYKVRIGFDEIPTSTITLKPGMTANISITTAQKQNTLYVPARAIKYNEEGERYVKILENGEEKEYPILVGIRANEGKQEIVEGVEEGQEVILSKKENK